MVKSLVKIPENPFAAKGLFLTRGALLLRCFEAITSSYTFTSAAPARAFLVFLLLNLSWAIPPPGFTIAPHSGTHRALLGLFATAPAFGTRGGQPSLKRAVRRTPARLLMAWQVCGIEGSLFSCGVNSVPLIASFPGFFWRDAPCSCELQRQKPLHE